MSRARWSRRLQSMKGNPRACSRRVCAQSGVCTVDAADVTKSDQEPECGPEHALMAVLTHCDCSPRQVATVRHEVRDQDRHELWHDDPPMWGFYLVHQARVRPRASRRPTSQAHPSGRVQRLQAGSVHALKRSHGALPEEGAQIVPGRARLTDRDVSTGAACFEGRWTRGAQWSRGGCFSV